MADLWTTRDLPVLRAYVEHFDDPNANRNTINLPEATGLDDNQIARALNALGRADPPYLKISSSMAGGIQPAFVLGVTERAYRAAGAWPTAEGLADSIAAAFDRAADAEPDPEQKSKLKATGAWLGGAGRSIAVDVMTRVRGTAGRARLAVVPIRVTTPAAHDPRWGKAREVGL